jgi:hypothetical protein
MGPRGGGVGLRILNEAHARFHFVKFELNPHHRLALASRSMPLASTFQHPVSQSGTGLVSATEFLFLPVPD